MSLSETLIAPVANPTAVALNVTLITQVPLAAMTRPLVQVVVAALPNGPVTVSAGVPSVIDTPVVLVRVILVGALVTPTGVVENDTLLGLSTTLLVPLPVKPTSCGEEGSLSLITIASLNVAVDLDPKVTLIEQLADAASVLPDAGQVFAEMA